MKSMTQIEAELYFMGLDISNENKPYFCTVCKRRFKLVRSFCSHISDNHDAEVKAKINEIDRNRLQEVRK